MSLQRRYLRENRECLPAAAGEVAQELYVSEDWATETAAILYGRRGDLPRVWCDVDQFAIERDGQRFGITKAEAVRLAAGETVDEIFGPKRKQPGRETRTRTQKENHQ